MNLTGCYVLVVLSMFALLFLIGACNVSHYMP